MVVSENGTIVRVIPCYLKDKDGNRTDKIKGYIIDYLHVWEDNYGMHTSLNNLYVNLEKLSDEAKQDFNDVLHSDMLFKSFTFSFDVSRVGARPFFRGIIKNDDFEIVSVEV